MDFVDWRKTSEARKAQSQEEQQKVRSHHGRRFSDYIEELIADAQKRGEFDNLPGSGKPLQIQKNTAAGDNEMAYHILQNNNLAPPEVDLLKEIDTMWERAQLKKARLLHYTKSLHTRRIPPFEREKRAYNRAVEQTIQEYEKLLKQINSKILTLNISAPMSMHRPLLKVDELVLALSEECPLFVL